MPGRVPVKLPPPGSTTVRSTRPPAVESRGVKKGATGPGRGAMSTGVRDKKGRLVVRPAAPAFAPSPAATATVHAGGGFRPEPVAASIAGAIAGRAGSSFRALRQPGSGFSGRDGAVGPTLTDEQRAARIVAAMVNPQVAQLTRDLQGRARAGMGAIGGYTNQLARALSGFEPRAAEIYRDAQARQAAADAALSGALRGEGQSQAEQLAETLRAQGLGQAVPLAQEQGQVAGGAANALLGLGSASLSQLIGEGAAARQYAAAQPGIARLAGLQGGRELQLATQRELADRVGQIRAQVPGLVQQQLAQLRQERGEAADRALERAIFEREFGLKVRAQQLDERRAVLDAQRDAARAAEQQRKWVADTFGVDPVSGLSTLEQRRFETNTRLAQARLAGKGGKGGASKKQLAEWRGTATAIAQDAYKGGVDADGNTLEPLSYQEAITEMMREGIPLRVALPALNRFYKPGERLRPYIGFYDRQRLARMGASPQELEAALWDRAAAARLIAKYAGRK